MADRRSRAAGNAAVRRGRSAELLPSDYAPFLDEMKARIQAARVKAVLAANREMVLLYWEFGRRILQQQQAQGWGAKVVERLAQDLRRAFPEMKGFSPRNLKYMRAFAEAWPELPETTERARSGAVDWSAPHSYNGRWGLSGGVCHGSTGSTPFHVRQCAAAHP